MSRSSAGTGVAYLGVHLAAEVGVGQPAAGHGDDAGLGGQAAVTVAVVERGKQLAHGQVAGAAEDDEVGGLRGRGTSGDTVNSDDLPN